MKSVLLIIILILVFLGLVFLIAARLVSRILSKIRRTIGGQSATYNQWNFAQHRGQQYTNNQESTTSQQERDAGASNQQSAKHHDMRNGSQIISDTRDQNRTNRKIIDSDEGEYVEFEEV